MQIQKVLLNLRAASAGAFEPPAPLFRFAAAAVVGPFILFTIGGSVHGNLPWYFWATIVLMLLSVMCIGFLRFASEYREAHNISISPDRYFQPRSES